VFAVRNLDDSDNFSEYILLIILTVGNSLRVWSTSAAATDRYFMFSTDLLEEKV
jgi:hypothetical protein